MVVLQLIFEWFHHAARHAAAAAAAASAANATAALVGATCRHTF